MAVPPPVVPAGGFGLIMADPPWAFRTHDGRSRTPTQKAFREAEDHYQTTPTEELMQIPVADWAARDAMLLMWVVGSHLDAALDLGRAWGFQLKTDGFYWLKTKLRAADQIDLFTDDVPPPRISMGYYSRKQLEPCWLFTRGRPQRLSKGVRQLIIEPAREHSRKPEAIYSRAEELCAGPYLEMFARNERPGWTAWGNEVGKFEAAA